MIILGIDPSINHIGWGVIKINNNSIEYIASSTIYLHPAWSVPSRLAKIANKIKEIIDTYYPEVVATETVFIDKDVFSALKLSYVRGVIMAVVGQCKLLLCEFAPTTIKKSITGSGRASKEQVKLMVKKIIPQAKPESSDEADALAIAYCCSVHNQSVAVMHNVDYPPEHIVSFHKNNKLCNKDI